MDNIKWIKKQIRSTLDYQYITKIVDDYLEKNDKDFLKQIGRASCRERV